jgi:hypothetical protein
MVLDAQEVNSQYTGIGRLSGRVDGGDLYN